MVQIQKRSLSRVAACRLRRGSMIETQQPAEPLNAFNCAEGRFRRITGLDQSIVDPLVIPLPVIMSGVLASRFPKRPFSEEDHAVQGLALDRSDEPDELSR